MPYMLYKDACNRKSNQQNVGVVKSGDFGGGIVEYTAPDEVRVLTFLEIWPAAFYRGSRV